MAVKSNENTEIKGPPSLAYVYMSKSVWMSVSKKINEWESGWETLWSNSPYFTSMQANYCHVAASISPSYHHLKNIKNLRWILLKVTNVNISCKDWASMTQYLAFKNTHSN